MIDILATRETYYRSEISGIGLIWGDKNPDDALSKLTGNRKLDRLIETHIDDTQLVQWIDCSSIQASTIATEERV